MPPFIVFSSVLLMFLECYTSISYSEIMNENNIFYITIYSLMARVKPMSHTAVGSNLIGAKSCHIMIQGVFDEKAI